MKRTTKRVLLGTVIALVALFGGYNVIWYWAVGYPFIDPPPKGEGSYDELDTLFTQFRKFYRTGTTTDLPTGFVRVNGFESEEPDARETWIIYYATASHSFRRGGTIVLLGSDGRIDGYFGHHCRRNEDGGAVILSPKPPSYWTGDAYFDGLEGVRRVFGQTFKHQRTEQGAPSNGG